MGKASGSSVKACRKALRLCEDGRLAEAREVLRAVCGRDAGSARAWSLLGMVHGRLGETERAVEACRRSLAIDPRQADVHCNLGIALETIGEAREAMASYARAVRIDPAHVEARKNLAVLLADAGRYDEAVAHFETALRQAPGNPDLLNDLANTLVCIDRVEEAERYYRAALERDPAHGRARVNLAALLFQSGERQEGMAMLDRLIEATPGDPAAHHNLAEMLQRVGLPERALGHYDEALRLDPDFVEARNHRGTVLWALSRHDEAEADFETALRLRPGYPEAWVNLAGLWLECGRIEAAEAAYRRAIGMREDFADAWNGLANCLVQGGRCAEGIAAYDRALVHDPGYREAASHRLLALHYDPAVDPGRLFDAHRLWARSFHPDAGSMVRPPAPSPSRRRLRIGYVSPDFRTHSVAYFIEPILRAHDPERFDVYCYAEVAVRDETSNRLAGLVGRWITTCGMGDAELAERIRRDGIDILVDLAGHTGRNRLGVFARRPAPVQIGYLGYPDTTGLPTVDYRLTDEAADPPGQADELYTERLYRLPSGFLCYAPPSNAPPVTERAGEDTTFASFNNPAKVNETVVDVWSRILAEVPDSRLLLKGRALADPAVGRRYLSAFESRGVDGDRLRLVGWTADNRSHLAMYGEVDIALDTFPYNGTTTTCEALWMGVPVVTMAGRHHAGRVGLSLMRRLGLEPLCVADPAAYVERAVDLANSPDKLARLRAGLRPLMRLRLCDGVAFTRDLETAYWAIWDEIMAFPGPVAREGAGEVVVDEA